MCFVYNIIVASLLTCLYQLKSENVNLEDELASYTRRRDHLLAVNARLAIPLAPQSNLFILIDLLLYNCFIKHLQNYLFMCCTLKISETKHLHLLLIIILMLIFPLVRQDLIISPIMETLIHHYSIGTKTIQWPTGLIRI